MTYEITLALSADHPGIDAFLRRAFLGPEEVALVRELRRTGAMAFELVAKENEVVGYVAVSRMVHPKGWMCLAPLAVDPEIQRRGLGLELTRKAVDFAVRENHTFICVLGRVAFYERGGFSQRRAQNLSTPYPIQNTMLAGPGEDAPPETLVYPAAFADT